MKFSIQQSVPKVIEVFNVYSVLLWNGKQNNIMLKFNDWKYLSVVLVIFCCRFPAFAQIPQDIPYQSKPTDFTDPLNIVLYIVLPVIMVIGYIWWRKKRRDNQE